MNNGKKMPSIENKSQLTYSYRRPVTTYIDGLYATDGNYMRSTGTIGVTTTTCPKVLYSYTMSTKDYFDNHPRRFAGKHQGRRITRTIGVTSTTRPTITSPST